MGDELERRIADLRAQLENTEALICGVEGALESAERRLNEAQVAYDQANAIWGQVQVAERRSSTFSGQGAQWRPSLVVPLEEQTGASSAQARDAFHQTRSALRVALTAYTELAKRRSNLRLDQRALQTRIDVLEAELARTKAHE